MDIKHLLSLRFKLLDRKKNRLFLVLFMMVYIVLFLNIFVPFDIDKWAPATWSSKFLTLSSFGIIGGMSIAFSQFLMRKWLKMEQFTVKQFLIWLFFELIFLTFLLTFIYSDLSGTSSFFHEFMFNFKHTFLIAVIPYSIVLLILSLFQSKSELKEIKKESEKVILTNVLVKLPDDKGSVKFTLPLDDLLYLESTDNYVYIYYLSNKELKKELLRNSLKNLELSFKDQPIKRCHRSYMVNLENLNLVKKTGQKIALKLNHVPDLIPVSKSYHQDFKEYLQMDD